MSLVHCNPSGCQCFGTGKRGHYERGLFAGGISRVSKFSRISLYSLESLENGLF